jgi:hypothetical protein
MGQLPAAGNNLGGRLNGTEVAWRGWRASFASSDWTFRAATWLADAMGNNLAGL